MTVTFNFNIFLVAHVKNDEDFFNLTIEKIVSTLNEDMNAVALFLTHYNTEKNNYLQSQDVTLNNSSNIDLNMSWSEDVLPVINQFSQDHGYTFLSEKIPVMEVTDEDIDNTDEILLSKEVESSNHNSVPGVHSIY